MNMEPTQPSAHDAWTLPGVGVDNFALQAAQRNPDHFRRIIRKAVQSIALWYVDHLTRRIRKEMQRLDHKPQSDGNDRLDGGPETDHRVTRWNEAQRLGF